MTGHRTTQHQPPQSWRAGALCQEIGVDLFFAPDGAHASEAVARNREAKRVCARCPVTAACLTSALGVESRESESWGVYGGLSGNERRAVISRQRNAA